MTRAHLGQSVAVTDLEHAVGVLRKRGLRVSAARRVLLEALFAADGPLTAEQIAKGVVGRVPESDLTSVYRNLETLEELGVVRHMHLGHGPGLYELAGSDREYLVCERCNSVRTVESREVETVRAAVKEATGFAARFDHFPLFGLCPDCQREVRSQDLRP
jgi:Fur family transcriptional regulator, ferric uptake regulator